MNYSDDSKFNAYYEQHCKHLSLKGLRPKTIEAYARVIRRIGGYFDGNLDNLTQNQLLDYFMKYDTKTVSVVDFLWLVLQHILPRGFRRSRDFGFMHPNSKALIKIIQWIHRLNPMFAISKFKPRKQMICPCCGATMRITKTRLPSYYALAVSEAP